MKESESATSIFANSSGDCGQDMDDFSPTPPAGKTAVPASQSPDELPAHAEQDRVIGHAERPVIHHGFIEQWTVLLT